VDGSAVSSTEVVDGPFFASRNEPAGVYSEVGTRVDQELPVAGLVRDEEAAYCRADMCRRWYLLRWFSLLEVGAGSGTLLHSGPEAAMVPAERGCGVSSGGGSVVRLPIPGGGRGSLALERGSLELREGSFELREWSLKLVRRRTCSVLSAATWRERSSISCRSVVLLGVGHR
jgi:hypothetical protein